METKMQSARTAGGISLFGIAPRLILSIMLYSAIVLLLMTALLYTPVFAVLGAFLVAIAIDVKRWINRRGAKTEGES